MKSTGGYLLSVTNQLDWIRGSRQSAQEPILGRWWHWSNEDACSNLIGSILTQLSTSSFEKPSKTKTWSLMLFLTHWCHRKPPALSLTVAWFPHFCLNFTYLPAWQKKFSERNCNSVDTQGYPVWMLMATFSLEWKHNEVRLNRMFKWSAKL